MRISCWIKATALSMLLAFPLLAKPSFTEYAEGLRQEAVERGYDADLIEQVFSSLQFHERVVTADRNQPERVETLDTYLPKRVSETRIRMARERYQRYQEQLKEVEARYGVQGRFIVALWGLESSFGRFMGNHSVPSSLATLAYEGRREAFFRSEFFHAMDILAAGHIELDDMKGSWAGAMGQSQFMPSSFLSYAQDFDGDGRKDIWGNQMDVFASIANYLKRLGWDNSQTWGREVKLPENFSMDYAIPRGTPNRAAWLREWARTERTLAEWQALGVRRLDGRDLPEREIKAALILPDNEGGRAYLAYDNYKTLMHWNRSYYFVTSVGYLADLIAAGE